MLTSLLFFLMLSQGNNFGAANQTPHSDTVHLNPKKNYIVNVPADTSIHDTITTLNLICPDCSSIIYNADSSITFTFNPDSVHWEHDTSKLDTIIFIPIPKDFIDSVKKQDKTPKPQAINFFQLQSSYQATINALPDSLQESASDFYLWQTITAQFINPDGSYPTIKSQPQQKQQYCKGNWSAVGITGNADEDYVTDCSAQPDNVGRVDAISFKPNDPNTIFIGTEGGQIYQRNDNTNNVTPIPSIDNKFQNGIAVIAISPSQSKTIYVASGNGVSYYAFGNNFSCSDGVWKSIDGGVSFNPVSVLNWGTASNTSITDIAVNPSNPNNVWVVGHQFFSPLFNQKPNGTVWHSLDGGKTWVTVNLGDHFFWHIKYGPDGKNLYLGGHRLYHSTDNGSTWTQVFLPGAIIDTTVMSSFFEIAVCPHGCPSSDNTQVAVFLENGNVANYWTSSDGFKTISAEKIIPSGDSGGIGVWALRPMAVAMGVNSGGGVYLVAAGAYLYYYDNGHGVFTKCNGISHQDIRCIASAPYNGLNGGTFYAGTDGGLFVSHDGGETWKSINDGLNCGLVYGVDVSPNGNMAIGAQDNAVFYSDYLNGYEFHHEYFGDGSTVIFDKNDASSFYSQDFQGSGEVYRASSTGSFCKEEIRIGNAIDPHASPIPMALDQSDKLYMGWKELYSYNGESTSQVTSLQSQFPNAGYITAIAVSKYSSQTVCIATQGAWSSSNYNDLASYMTSNLFISHDGGATWMNISPQIPAVKGQITSVLLDAEVAGDVWFTMGGYTDLNNKNENVFYSFEPVIPHDLWIKQSSGLPQMPTTKIVEDDNNTMYVATDLGVYYTNASLAYQWKCFSANLPTTRIMDLEIHNGIVYAGTWGRGLWQSPVLGSEPTIETTASSDSIFPTNAKWVYEIEDGSQGQQLDYVNTYRTDSIVMINGMKYTDLITENGLGGNGSFFYRVDGEKVIFRYNDSDVVLMDFSLNVGDTLWNIYKGVDTSGSYNIYSTVTGIDSVMIDGKYHKRLTIGNSNEWIEGVGSIWDISELLSPIEEYSGLWNTLTCFFENGVKLYSQPSPSGMFDCDQFLNGISSQPQTSIIAYSTNGQIIVKNKSDHGGTVMIYDVLGRSYYYSILPANTYNIVPLHSGTYIVNWISDQGIKESKKVIVQ